MDYSGDSKHMFALHNLVQCGIKYDKLPGKNRFIFLYLIIINDVLVLILALVSIICVILIYYVMMSLYM